jgi:hypothetical protein
LFAEIETAYRGGGYLSLIQLVATIW